MFRSRSNEEKGGSGRSNKEVNVQLLRDREGDEAAAIKVRFIFCNFRKCSVSY